MTKAQEACVIDHLIRGLARARNLKKEESHKPSIQVSGINKKARKVPVKRKLRVLPETGKCGFCLCGEN